jgi:nitroreductase
MKTIQKQIMEAFQFRHACKHYDPAKKVSEEDFTILLEAARLSPSSFGFEPWRFLVIENRDLLEKLYPLAWGARNSIEGSSRFIIILARKRADTLFNSDYLKKIMENIHHLPEEAARKRTSAFENFEKNDFKLLGDERYLFDWACMQTYIPLANMMTAAALMKIDSCPIEGFDRTAVENLLVREGIIDNEHFGVSVMVSFGYRATDPRPKTRQPAEDVIRRIK